MQIPTCFEVPRVIGHLDPERMRAVETFPFEQSRPFSVSIDDNGLQIDTIEREWIEEDDFIAARLFMGIAAPELLGYKATGALAVTVASASAPPFRSQRLETWHRDDGAFPDQLDLPIVFAASSLPTEFLVSTIEPTVEQLEQQLEMVASKGYLIHNPHDIKRTHGLRVWKPRPGEVVVCNNNFHRSPTNFSPRKIARTFMRAGIPR